ncbi:hypothetical protein [Endozoicomonas sp. SESOKO2]|uniref:hypothetical protein n=1 Tax=Endozoicomonas sp. SESOKO2 TaxID=2828743 RepID=UPI00214741DA|nr:hypothetical protein [Endozoicomonas sp. SESOKO2]
MAGHLSLWPPDQPWWQPLRFVRTGLVVYNTYTTDDPHFIPLIAMTYFTRETVARTVAGACTVETLSIVPDVQSNLKIIPTVNMPW